MNSDFRLLAEKTGIVFMGAPNPEFQKEDVTLRSDASVEGGFACDAQPTLVTQSNAGIPAFLTTYVDPKLIEILLSPMQAVEVVGKEVKKGDWVTETAMFPVVESTGETSSYGDYSENGSTGVNTNFPQRQAYTYQTVSQWGEREMERAGKARIDWANRVSIASVLTLNKYQNKTYFFGVAGLQNYGLLNDPNLSAPISPTTKAAGGTGWANATALEVYADIQALYTQLQSQANGTIDLKSEMTLSMSPTSETALTKTTQFNVNVEDLLKKNFPNMKIRTAVEYATTSGQLVQLKADNVEGQETAECAFTEKLRAHPVVVKMSSFKQKKSQGTYGTVIYRPVFIAGMLGV